MRRGGVKTARGPGKFVAVWWAAAAGLMLGAASVQATTYYVSQSSGNDSWTGQAASPEGANGPWKTLAATRSS